MKLPIVCLAVVLAGPAAAQGTGWSFAGSFYVWVPALSSSLGTPEGTVDADLSASDAIANLEFAFMGAFEARNGRWGLIGDLLYTDISVSKDTPFGRLFSSAEVDNKFGAFSGYGLYRVHETEAAAFDLGAGFRAFRADIDATLTAGRLPEQSFGADETWVDPLIAARAIVNFNDRWFATTFADIGGVSGSDSTWQTFVSVGYHFNERWSTQFGYRYMELEKDIGSQDLSMELYGPLLGFTIHF